MWPSAVVELLPRGGGECPRRRRSTVPSLVVGVVESVVASVVASVVDSVVDSVGASVVEGGACVVTDGVGVALQPDSALSGE